MTKAQVITGLLQRYNYVLSTVKPYDNHIYILGMCSRLRIHNGVCFALYSIYEVNFFNIASWIIKHTPTNEHYWCIRPSLCTTTQQIIDSIKFRINILEQELLIP